ncbi:unnamed protein product [Lampetra planeri]
MGTREQWNKGIKWNKGIYGGNGEQRGSGRNTECSKEQQGAARSSKEQQGAGWKRGKDSEQIHVSAALCPGSPGGRRAPLRNRDSE